MICELCSKPIDGQVFGPPGKTWCSECWLDPENQPFKITSDIRKTLSIEFGDIRGNTTQAELRKMIEDRIRSHTYDAEFAKRSVSRLERVLEAIK